MAGDDDLELRAVLDDAVSAVLARIEARIKATEERLDDLGEAGERSGDKVDAGAEKAAGGLGKQEDQSKRTREETKRLGEEVDKAGKKASASASGWDALEKKLKKTAKAYGGFSKLLTVMKIYGVVGALFALAGALSAVGAAAVMAVGAIGSALPGLAALGPIAMAGYLGMKAFTLGSKALKPEMEAFKKSFDSLGQSVAKGGMAEGLKYLTNNIGPFRDALNQGFTVIGGSIGRAEHALADWLTDSYRVGETNQIFAASGRIIDKLVPGVLGFTGGLLHGLVAAIPAGERLTGVLSNLGTRFEGWMRQQLDSGRATEVINKGLDHLLQTGRTLSNYLVGLFNIFKIGAQAATGLGDATERASQKFRAWTASAEGQNKIRDYFEKAKPAIIEMGLLIRDIFKMFANLAASESIAPLLRQIRTEFLPALGELLGAMTGAGGLLPALVTIATAFARFFAAIDPSALVILANAIAGVVNVLAWITANVPGAGMVISALATAFLLLGPAAKIATIAMSPFKTAGSMFTWMKAAAAGTGELSAAQKLLGPQLAKLGPLFGAAKVAAAEFFITLSGGAAADAIGGSFAAKAGMAIRTGLGSAIAWVSGTLFPALATAARAAWIAVTGPVGLVVLAIAAVIAIIVLLWNKCEWFRNAVTAVWEWIKTAAVAAWDWIKMAWDATVTAIVTAAMWIWTNGIKPVIDFIVAAWNVCWTVIKFVVQVAVFLIVGYVTMMWTILSAIWNAIATAATWVWQNIILPVIQFVATMAVAIWQGVVAFFTMIWNAISMAATWVWQSVILPVIQFVATMVMTIWNGIMAFFTTLWNMIAAAASAVWNGVILPVIQVAASVVMAVWSPIAGFFSAIWSGISSGASAVFNFVKGIATSAASAISSAWTGMVNIIKGAYNSIVRVWNSVPSIKAPDALGGATFSLPKLPAMWHGGTIQYKSALVGEQGPEPLLSSSGRFMGMLGANGPEVRTDLPKGGYVVPNLGTLTRMPGLMKSLPSGVASAVASSVPGYAGLLKPTAAPPPPAASARRDDRELVGAMRAMARAVGERPPPIAASGDDVEAKVLRALRKWEREKDIRGRHTYDD